MNCHIPQRVACPVNSLMTVTVTMQGVLWSVSVRMFVDFIVSHPDLAYRSGAPLQLGDHGHVTSD